MRVQPHLPSSPFTATVTESSGAALWACNAANRPAPPEPRIRMSVSSCRTWNFLTLDQELRPEHDGDESEPGEVEQRLRIDKENASDEQHPALVARGLLEEPALEAAAERHDADRRRKGDER